MTLSERNKIFRICFFIPVIILVGMAFVSVFVMPVYSAVFNEASHRPTGFIQNFVAQYSLPQTFAPFAAIICAVLYSLIATIFIYFRFQKTQSPEILYICFFVLSFAFEGTRIMLPIKAHFDLPGIYLIMASRVLFFGRYFGFFALFAASVYAAGLEIQKQRPTLAAIALLTLVLSINMPIDGLSWDTALVMSSGYNTMFTIVNIGISLITLVSFAIASYSRGLKEYLYICLGAFLVLLGRNILFSADTWLTLFPAMIILIAGTWFICKKLHKVYLWF